MASKTEVANLAISHLGVGKEIQDIDTDKTSEAEACRRFYDIALVATLRDFNWPFARRILTLNLVESNPNEMFDYSYRYPSSAAKVRRILSGTWPENRQNRVPFLLASDDSGRLIYTSQANAMMEYTHRVEDPSLYTPDFEIALSYRVAMYIAPRITDVTFNYKGQMRDLYLEEIEAAASNANNEEQTHEEVESEFIRART